jgi:hypothetical protein
MSTRIFPISEALSANKPASCENRGDPLIWWVRQQIEPSALTVRQQRSEVRVVLDASADCPILAGLLWHVHVDGLANLGQVQVPVSMYVIIKQSNMSLVLESPCMS